MNNKCENQRITYAPIVVFVYNRFEHTKRMFESLIRNEEAKQSDLFIFSDAPKNENENNDVELVRKYIDSITGFKSIHITKRDNNLGLAKSVISGVTQIINEYEKVIVIEDDLILSKYFLNYMNGALNSYGEDKRIFSISGFVSTFRGLKDCDEDVFLFGRASSWGWGTWKDRWESVDWSVSDYDSFKNNKRKRKAFNDWGGRGLSEMLDSYFNGNISSWAIRWVYSQFIQNKYTVYPKMTFVQNLGMDGTGTNCGYNTDTDLYEGILADSPIFLFPPLKLNNKLCKQMHRISSSKRRIDQIVSVVLGRIISLRK